MAEKTKTARISSEKTRLTRYFALADPKSKGIAAPLIQNAAFMKATLEDLQEIINADGLVEEYQNGSAQKGMKQSAALQGYNAMVKNYTTVIKTLAHILVEARQEKGTTLSDVMSDLMNDE